MKKTFWAIVLLAMVVAGGMVLVTDRYQGTTIHLAGDSTLSVKLVSRRPETGWGEPIANMLCPDVRLVNRAKNGRSTKSFISEGLWKKLLNNVRAGDIVIIQFGHNDQKKNELDLYASPWREYRDNLNKFVSDVKEVGAEPVLLTSIVRRAFNSQGELERTLGDYPAVTREVASTMNVVLIDLNKASYKLVSTMGPIASKQLYLHLAPGSHENYIEGKWDDTHLSPQGALEIATLAAVELEKNVPGVMCIQSSDAN